MTDIKDFADHTLASTDYIVAQASGGSGGKAPLSEILGLIQYPYGLGTVLAADTDHDITINAGAIPSSDGTTMLVLPSAITKRIDAAWAVGDTNGGLFSGSPANDTWYYYYLIKKDSDGSIDAYWDTSLTAANIPSGYTKYRRIACHRTDGSANILSYVQYGKYFNYKDYRVDLNGTPATSITSLTISVPPVPVMASLVLWMASGSVRTGYVASPNIVLTTLLGLISAEVATIGNRSAIVGTDTGQIKYAASATGTMIILTIGWQDMGI